MNTRQLVKIVSDITGESEELTKAAINTAFFQIASALTSGEEVAIMGFGRFVRKDVRPRAGRNPVTGKAMVIPASRRVSFTPGKQLKERI